MIGIISFACRRPVSVFMIAFMGLTASLWTLFPLPLEYAPDISATRFTVTTPCPGLTAEEVKNFVSVPLEESLSTVRGAKRVTSVSRDGRASLTIDFAWGEDPLLAAGKIREAVDAAYPRLPEDTPKPVVIPGDPLEQPVMIIALIPSAGDLALAKRIAERDLKTAIQRAEGVGSVVVTGGYDREYKIRVDEWKASARGISGDMAADFAAREHSSMSAGSVRDGSVQISVKTEGAARTPAEVLAFRVPAESGSFPFRDIATVEDSFTDRESAFSLDGTECVGLKVFKRKGAGPTVVSDSVRKQLAMFSDSGGKGMTVVIAEDSSENVRAAVSDLAFQASLGAAIAFLVIFLFSGNPTSSLILISTIPVCVLFALACLKAAGASINIMTIGGLSIGIGMISDNAVVVLESLGLAARRKYLPLTTIEMRDAVYSVSGSSIASTATTLIVFVPVLFLPGPVGALFRDLSLAVIFTLASSLAVAMTLVPALYAVARPIPTSPRLGRELERGYGAVLGFFFRNPFRAVALSLIVIVSGGIAYPFIHRELMPRDDARTAVITADYPDGTTLERMARDSERLSGALSRTPFGKRARAESGFESDDHVNLSDPFSRKERTIFFVDLPDGIGQRQAVRAISEKIDEFSSSESVSCQVHIPPGTVEKALESGMDGSLWAVKGTSPEEARSKADGLISAYRSSHGNTTVTVFPDQERTVVELIPDRPAIANAGVDFSGIARTIRTSSDGVIIGTIADGGIDIPLRVISGTYGRRSSNSLRLAVATAGIPGTLLGDLCTVREEGKPSAYFRIDRSDAVILSGWMPGSDGELPEVEPLSAEDGKETTAAIFLSAVLVVILLYLFLGAQFESFLIPFLLLLALPFSVAGVLLALYVSGTSINIGTGLGAVVILGAAANNAIILEEAIRERIGKGTPSKRRRIVASYRGAKERFVPILVTTLTNILSVLPIAIFSGVSSQRGLSISVIGGIACSAAVSLFTSPLLFALVFGGRKATNA